ncbi:MAG TPA: SAM-dependent chlorinase/fluorinase [Fervidobacterium sp.]|nr:SAM-dependent chlorinase/fluorinase [Fervidobacterium sp.]HOM73782.1 SAM-dependent chlorinase/fluorinase [Fervidobacterium sp.]HPP18032.1 SAM-dependent chlorinase/fluorinase [Fervidobacterium sp.]
MIAFMTDWGNSHYVGICKGVIRNISDTEIIDLIHNITPYNVREAMHILDRSIDWFPEKTVFLVVVDHGVGTARKAIAVETEKYYFVAPDNGVLTLALEKYQPKRIVDLTNKKYHTGASKTFHGRDIFAPAAAYITKGIFEELGSRLPNYGTLPHRKAIINQNTIYGEVAYFDKFGNLETNIPFSWVENKDNVKLKQGNKAIEVPVVEAYADVNEGELLLHEDSTGYIEIAINKGTAREKLKYSEGSEVEIIL